MNHYVFVRTTIDLPENLHRALKARAGLTGVSFRDLIQSLIEHGLRAPASISSGRTAPPVIVAANGTPLPAVPRSEITDTEDAEDPAKYA